MSWRNRAANCAQRLMVDHRGTIGGSVGRFCVTEDEAKDGRER